MKTQITKKNAMSILEGAIRQQRLVNNLEKILDCDSGEWNVCFSDFMLAIFNIEDSIDDQRYDDCFNLFLSVADSKSTNYEKLSEKLYNKCLKASLKEERQKSKTPGVVSLLKGENYNIQGNFTLET